MTLDELWFWMDGAMWLNTPEKKTEKEEADAVAMAQLEAQGMGV